LRGFVAIAEVGSFAEACERLHISQPALSVSIRKLEQGSGGLLFARSTRSVELTPEGRQFLPIAKRLLGDWAEGFDDLQQLFTLQRGKLTIAAMPSYASNCLPKVLTDYGQQFPNITLTVQDIIMEDVITAVQSGRVELGITFKPDRLDGVDFSPLFTDRFIAILPPHHTLATKQNIAVSDLFKEPLVALNRGSSTRQWVDQLIIKSAQQGPQIFEAFQLTTVGAMVVAGVGVALVPALCGEQMQKLGAVCRPISGPSIERQVGIFTRRRHALSAPAQAMMRLLQQSSAFDANHTALIENLY
jgi:LysR family carnitine catabolism transcriptional activator